MRITPASRSALAAVSLNLPSCSLAGPWARISSARSWMTSRAVVVMSESSVLLCESDSDVDELVFLAADELAPAGFDEDLRARDAVAPGLGVRVLEEGGVHAGVAHRQREPVEQALAVHHRPHHVLRGIDDLQRVDAGADAQLLGDRHEGLDRRVAGPGAEAAGGPVDLLGAAADRDDRVGHAEAKV